MTAPAVSAPAVAERRTEFAALGGVRAIAAYIVIATHAGFESGRSLENGPWAPLLARLNFGVTLFFLLSGFLLSRQFLTDTSRLSPDRVGKFWWRRGLRILPAYWVAVAGSLALLTAERPSVGDWASYLGLVQTYDHHYVNNSLAQSWTLVVELSFYAVLPFLIWGSRQIRRPRHQQLTALVLAMILAALAANLIIHGWWPTSTLPLLWLPVYLDWFALGILLASLSMEPGSTRWRRILSEWSQSPGTCWIVGALLIWFSTLPLAGPRSLVAATTWQWTIEHVVFGVAAFFFLLPLTQRKAGTGKGWPDSLLGNKAMQWLGEVSYGVYLWHLGLLLAISRWMGWPLFGGHFLAMFGLTALAATGVAALSWHYLERPLLRRFSSSWRSTPRDQAPNQDNADRDQEEQLHTRAVGQGMV
jgi:peptidoglycan/LPS O-acetylase OafA/YrhL